MKFLSKAFLIILFFVLPFSDLSGQNSELKIISYNVLEGMKLDTTSNKREFSNWVNSQKPDIIALQELNFFTQEKLEQLAKTFHHPYAVLLKEKGYPVGITSKFPIINVEKVLDNMWHGFLKVEIKGYNIYVIHLSPHFYKKRREEIELILETSLAESTKPKKTLIMGDFNALTETDTTAYKDGRVLDALQNADNRSSKIENLENGKLDYQVHQKITRAGYVDAFRFVNQTFESSAPTLKFSKKQSASKRIDFIYVSKDLKRKLNSASIVKDDFTNVHSDHYPVMIKLKNKQ